MSAWPSVARTTAAMLVAFSSVVVAAGNRADASPPAAWDLLLVANRDSDNVGVLRLRADGTLVEPGDLVPAGDGPRGIALHPSGRFAYVANIFASTISAYRIESTGKLRPIGQPVPSRGRTPLEVSITPDGKHLFAPNVDSDSVSVFDIARDGTLTPNGPPVTAGVTAPRGTLVTRDGRFLYVSLSPDEGPGAIVTFAIVDGHLVPRGAPVMIGTFAGGLAATPDGSYLYATSSGDDVVYGFRMERDGSLRPVPGVRFPTNAEPDHLAVTADGRHLYVTGEALRAYTIRADGSLRRVDDTEQTGSPIAVASGPGDCHLYVAKFDTNDISIYRIGPRGTLREIKKSPVLTGGLAPPGHSLAIRPGQHTPTGSRC